MSIVLARIDDRLVHGQVTVGWGQALTPERILLASDTIAADPWQSRVYAAAAPPEIEVVVKNLNDAAALLRGETDRQDSGPATILLTANPADMHGLLSRGVALTEVNLGGMHYSAGKQELLSYVYVDGDDLAVLRTLLAAQVKLCAQQVPGGKAAVIDQGLIVEMEGRM